MAEVQEPRLTESIPGDAFGEMLLAYARGAVEFGSIERDDGQVEEHDPALYFTEVSEWGHLERLACELTRGRVLDVGSGAGRHVLHLEALGHQVTGLDPSAGACQVSRSLGCQDISALPVQRAGELEQTYDTIVMLGNNLALLGSPEQAGPILDQLAAVSRPDTRILGISRDPLVGAQPEHLRYHELNRSRGRPAGQTTLRTCFRGWVDDWFDYWLMSSIELEQTVAPSSWELINITPDPPFYLAELGRRP